MEVLPISNKELQINEQIRDKEVRVVDSDGTQLGIMPLKQALELAEQRDLDLVKCPVKVTCFVASTPDFYAQPQVATTSSAPPKSWVPVSSPVVSSPDVSSWVSEPQAARLSSIRADSSNASSLFLISY